MAQEQVNYCGDGRRPVLLLSLFGTGMNTTCLFEPQEEYLLAPNAESLNLKRVRGWLVESKFNTSHKVKRVSLFGHVILDPLLSLS